MQNIFREFVFILFDRIRLITIIFLGIFLVALASAVFLPARYQATAKFSLKIPESLDPLQKENFYDYKNRIRGLLRNQKELIASNQVLKLVVERVMADGKGSLSKKIEKIREHLTISPPKGESFEDTNVFYLTYEDRSPERAAEVTKAIAEAYIDTYRRMGKSLSDYSYTFFGKQTEELLLRMQIKEKELREYEREHALVLIEILNLESGTSNMEVGPNAQLTSAVQRVHELREELAGIHMIIRKLEAEIRPGHIPVILPEMEVDGRAITVFKNKVAQLQIQLNEMKAQFMNNYEPYQHAQKELDYNVDSLRGELVRAVRAKKITANRIEARIKALEKIIRTLKQRIRDAAQQKSIYEQIRQEYRLAKEAYAHSRTQMEQSRIAHALNQEKQHLSLLDEPVVPAKPIKPNRWALIIMGIFSGIFMGIAVALTVDHFDHSIKKTEDIDRYLQVPCLGSIPQAEAVGN